MEIVIAQKVHIRSKLHGSDFEKHISKYSKTGKSALSASVIRKAIKVLKLLKKKKGHFDHDHITSLSPKIENKRDIYL